VYCDQAGCLFLEVGPEGGKNVILCGAVRFSVPISPMAAKIAKTAVDPDGNR
jgi:hypothetical protein